MQKQMVGRGGPHGEDRLLLWPQLKQMVPSSRTTIWRGVRDGWFPAPIKISPGRIAWLESEILEWISRRRRGP